MITIEQAKSVIFQVDTIRKNKKIVWECESLRVLETGQAIAFVRFNVDKVTVKHWFHQATAKTLDINHFGNDYYQVVFELIPVEVNNALDFGWLT